MKSQSITCCVLLLICLCTTTCSVAQIYPQKSFENCCARGFHHGFLERTFGTRAYLLYQPEWPSCEVLPADEADRVTQFCRRLTWLNSLDCTLGQYAASVHGRCDHLLGPESYACCASCLTGLAIADDRRIDPNRPVCISPQPELRLPVIQQCCMLKPNAPKNVCTRGITICSADSYFGAPLSALLTNLNPPRFVPPMLPPIAVQLNQNLSKMPAILPPNDAVLNAPDLLSKAIVSNVNAKPKWNHQSPANINQAFNHFHLNVSSYVHDHKQFVNYNAFELSRFQNPSLRKSLYNASKTTNHIGTEAGFASFNRQVPAHVLQNMFCPLQCPHPQWCFVRKFGANQHYCDLPLNCSSGQTPNESNHRCVPLNECKRAVHNCHAQFEVCVDTYDGFMCECRPGYRRSLTPPHLCVNINECLEQDRPCPLNSKCVDREPGYECNCLAGFEHINSECILRLPAPAPAPRPRLRPMGSKRLVDQYDLDTSSPLTTVSSKRTNVDLDLKLMPVVQQELFTNDDLHLNSIDPISNVSIPNQTPKINFDSNQNQTQQHAPVKQTQFVLKSVNMSDVLDTDRHTNVGKPNGPEVNVTVGKDQLPARNESISVRTAGDKDNSSGGSIVSVVHQLSASECPKGYRMSKGKCVDVDECLDRNPCKDDLVCFNLLGSFECRVAQLSAADRFVSGRQSDTSFWADHGSQIAFWVIGVNLLFILIAVNVTTLVYKRMHSQVAFDLQPKSRFDSFSSLDY